MGSGNHHDAHIAAIVHRPEAEQELADALAELLATIRYREPREGWLEWRSDAMARATSLLTEGEIERGGKMRTTFGAESDA